MPKVDVPEPPGTSLPNRMYAFIRKAASEDLLLTVQEIH